MENESIPAKTAAEKASANMEKISFTAKIAVGKAPVHMAYTGIHAKSVVV